VTARPLWRLGILDQPDITLEIEDSALQHPRRLPYIALVTSDLANLFDQLVVVRLDHASKFGDRGGSRCAKSSVTSRSPTPTDTSGADRADASVAYSSASAQFHSGK